jgi:hypothetical protein
MTTERADQIAKRVRSWGSDCTLGPYQKWAVVLVEEIERLRQENADLRHDLERSMNNHVADLNGGALR